MTKRKILCTKQRSKIFKIFFFFQTVGFFTSFFRKSSFNLVTNPHDKTKNTVYKTKIQNVSKYFFSSKLLAFSLLCLMHEGVEGVVEGVHEVGVVDWGLGAWKGRGIVREEEL